MDPVSDQLRVKLELFEGPLDLLLHLIRTQHIDIAAIPIAKITRQYLETIRIMKELDLDIAGEYLVMASTLILIKSRMLLPPSSQGDNDESAEVMQAELVRRLKEYEVFKEAGQHLHHLEQERQLVCARPTDEIETDVHTEWVIEASLVDLLKSLRDILDRKQDLPHHVVRSKPVSVRSRMSAILKILSERGSVIFRDLFSECDSRQDIIGTFLAVLELMRLQAIRARQRKMFGDIRLVAYRPDEVAGT
ncbi:MAG TPA: segregation/condensation protein A [bacterium]|nr:segregation/condensation protein A [bacterium]